jgi:hypothetical protein
LPLAELEARQLSLIQCCVFPKMLSPHDNVRKASTEAEQKIDAHILSCSLSENVKMFTGLSKFMLQRENRFLRKLNVTYSVCDRLETLRTMV